MADDDLAVWAVADLGDQPPRTDLAAPTLRRRLLASGLDLVLVVVVTLGIDTVVAFAMESRGGQPETFRSVSLAVQFIVGVLLLLVLPMLPRDRATPGQLTVLLALRRPREDTTPPAWSVPVRFVVRWLPILIWGVPAVVVVAVAEVVTARVRSDRRSLAGLVARTVTTTHDALLDNPTPSDQHAAS